MTTNTTREDRNMNTTTTTTTRYNGWANYATWNVNLWVINEEPAYRAMDAHLIFTPDSAREFVQRHFPGGTPDLRNGRGLSEVDWQEIADAWNEGKALADGGEG